MDRTSSPVVLVGVIVVAIAAYYFIRSPSVAPSTPLGGDGRRLADMHDLKEALAAYFKDHDAYPATPAGASCDPRYNNIPGLARVLVPQYIKSIPTDPNPPNCRYNYRYISDTKNYTLMVHLERIDPAIYHDHWCIGASGGAGTSAGDGYFPCP